MELQHLGYVVADINKTAAEFKRLGYTQGEVLYDEALQVELCFLTLDGKITIELIHQHNPDSLENHLLNLNGVMPYHICYETEDIYADCQQLINAGYKALFDPVEVKALGGKKICYLHKAEIGYVELTEK